MAAGGVALGEIFTADAADALFERGEALRAALNAACAAAGVPMHFTGLGSLASPHFRAGPIDRAYAPTAEEEGLRELFFFDMLEAGLYLARRGMVALSLPLSQPDLDRFVAAVAEFAEARAPSSPGRSLGRRPTPRARTTARQNSRSVSRSSVCS